PTKIEGNPSHPISGGKTDAHLQARILDLYDDERSGHPRQGEETKSWAEFDAWWREKAAELEGNRGSGLRILMPPTASPSVERARNAFHARFPAATIHTWSAISEDSSRLGTGMAFGQPHVPVFALSGPRGEMRAKVIASFDSDFLAGERGFLAHARGFAAGRTITSTGSPMNRLYVLEGTLSVTGMNADERLRIAPSQVDAHLRGLAAKLGSMDVSLQPAIGRAVDGAFDALPEASQRWIEKLAADLVRDAGDTVVTVGWRQPFHVHALAHAINTALGNVGNTVHYFPEPDPTERNGLGELVEAMQAGLDTLIILGGNPVYDAPGDLGFAEALGSVQNSVHLSMHVDETSSACSWHLPMAHELESWGDTTAIDGTYALQQPLIAPLRGGRSPQELFAMVAGIRAWRGYNLVRRTLREEAGPVGFERVWRSALHAGVVQGQRPRSRQPAIQDSEVAAALTAHPVAEAGGWEAVFIPSYQTWDGAEAHNPWLQEMPDPVTKVVWGNCAYLSPASALELGLLTQSDFDREEYEGSFPSGWNIDITTPTGSVTIPAIVLPGHADQVVTLPLGFGRTMAGEHGSNVGVDVNKVRASDALGFATGVEVRRGTGQEIVVQTQDHFSMAQHTPLGDVTRPLAIDATLDQYHETPDFAQWREPTPTLSPLWTQEDYSQPRPPAQGGRSYQPFPTPREAREGAPPRYKWGMV
ncbi:MAG: hypothetical protein KC619_02475, partial [Myxococcales bacterium]|nr:hypothetical protein [Myxococcales bacterium]